MFGVAEYYIFLHYEVTCSHLGFGLNLQSCSVTQTQKTLLSLSSPLSQSCELKNKNVFSLEYSLGGSTRFLLSVCLPVVLLHVSINPAPSPFALLLQVDIHIPTHPRLRPSDSLQCVFGSFVSGAVMVFDSQGLITCSLPEPVDIPPTPDQQGRWTQEALTAGFLNIRIHVSLPVPTAASGRLHFHSENSAHQKFTTYLEQTQ